MKRLLNQLRKKHHGSVKTEEIKFKNDKAI